MGLRDYLIESQPNDGKPVPVLSAEGIKLVFDVVRNYALAMAVLFGALEYNRIASAVLLNQAPDSTVFIANVIGWVLFALAGMLLLLNALFATYVFELTPFYRRRSAKFRWAVLSVVLCTLLGILLCGALVFARRNAA